MRTDIMSWPRSVGYQGCSKSLTERIMFMPLCEIVNNYYHHHHHYNYDDDDNNNNNNNNNNKVPV
jgi:hypothetical protein